MDKNVKRKVDKYLDFDGVMISIFYCFDILPKERRTLLDLKTDFSKAVLDQIFAERMRNRSYNFGEIDEVDKKLFYENYLEKIPFLRWELKPEEILLEVGSSKSIRCKARTYATIWQSGFLSVTMSLCFMKERIYEKLEMETKQTVIRIEEPLSVDDIISLEKFGFPCEANKYLREKAEKIHHETLAKLYGWNGNYEELQKKIRYANTEAWFLTTIVQRIETKERNNFWEKYVYDLLAFAYFAEDWRETPKYE